MQPSEDGGENEALPVAQLDKRAGEPLALDVRRELNESADALGRGAVEVERKIRIPTVGARQVIELALTSETRPLAGRDILGQDIAAITQSSSDMRKGIYCGLAGGAKSAQGSAFLGIAGSCGRGFARPRSAGVIPNLASRFEICVTSPAFT